MTRKAIKRTLGDALDPGQYDQLLALKDSLKQTPPAPPVKLPSVQKSITKLKVTPPAKLPTQQSRTLQLPTTQTDKCHPGEKKNCSHETVSAPRNSTNQSPLSPSKKTGRLRKARVDKVTLAVTHAEWRHKQRQVPLTNQVKDSMEKHRVHLVDGSLGAVKLKVRRGKILKSEGHCSSCHTAAAPLTRYADSNYGPVILCTVCKIRAFELTFGHADAMPLKVDHAHAHKGKW